jgi:hypothetical protein
MAGRVRVDSLSPERLLQAAAGFGALRVVRAAIDLGLFTELGKGPRSCDQLCRRLGLDRRLAPSLLDTLLGLGWLEREGDDAQAIYVNTREAGHFLDQRSPAFLGPLLQFTETAWLNPPQGLAAALRDPGQATRTDRPAAVAACLAQWHGEALADRLDFSPWQRLLGVDTGDGSAAALVGALVARHPQLVGSAVVATDREAAWPMVDVLALNLVGGSSAPQRALLLQRARAALAPQACLVIVDHLLDDSRRLSATALLHSLARQLEGAAEAPLTAQALGIECLQAGLNLSECLPLPGGASALIVRR